MWRQTQCGHPLHPSCSLIAVTAQWPLWSSQSWGWGLAQAWPDLPLFWQRAFNATSFLRHIRKLGQSPEAEGASEQGLARHSHSGLHAGQPPKW